ncbi:MAG: DUF2007 domain-containing protein [Candidatus Hydrogenedentes bacterium]|nr:DUF2007 domain-containing protein [Candidatus Hydrogenedentota bacterium]
MGNDQAHNLKVLKKCSSDLEAQMIVDLLKANGIHAIIENSLPHSILPVTGDAIILVREEDYKQAIDLYECLQVPEEEPNYCVEENNNKQKEL